MYKLTSINTLTNTVTSVIRLSDKAFIPFDPDNTDYQHFKKQINEDKAELQDADGNVMSAEEAKSYIATLPA